MTKEQEAHQEQTIAEIRDRVDDCYDNVDDDLYIENDIVALLEIVDSRAQKIAEQQSEINGYKSALAIEQTDAEKLRKKIAEQANEIERLTWLRCGKIK